MNNTGKVIEEVKALRLDKEERNKNTKSVHPFDNELLRIYAECPFCKNQNNDFFRFTDGGLNMFSTVAVMCCCCSSHGPVKGIKSVAVDAWNER